MPTKPFNINRAITVLIIAIIVSGWLLARSYFTSVSVSKDGPLVVRLRNPSYFLPVFYLLLFTIEIFVYRWLRHKHIVKQYANIHILSVLAAKIIIPLLYMAFIYTGTYYFSINDMYSIVSTIVRPLQWAATLFLITGHVFFILAIIKRNNYPDKENADETSGDVLQEFAE